MNVRVPAAAEFSRSEWMTIRKALAVHFVKLTAQIRRAKANQARGRRTDLASLAMEAADVELLFTRLKDAMTEARA